MSVMHWLFENNASLLAAPFLAFAKAEFKTLDVSQFANVGFEASQEGEFAPVKNLKPAKNANFGGVKFDIIDSSANGGKSAIALSSTLVKSPKSLRVDLSDNKDRYKYLYILHNAGDKILSENQRGNIATIVFSSAKETGNAYPKKHIEGGGGFKVQNLENARAVYIDDAKSGSGVLYLSQIPLAGIGAPLKEIKINPTGHAAWNIFAMTLSDVPVSTGPSYGFNMSDWKAVDLSDIEIVDGSALDLTSMMTDVPAGKHGRVIVNARGQFAFSQTPDVRVKFKGTNWRPGDEFFKSIKTHDDIDRVARQFRKQGYNMLRWRISMRSGEFDAQYQMKPAVRDLYDYFIFALAREGVYSHWNLSSHDLGEKDFQWQDRFDLKCRFIFGDPSARESWRKLMKMQLEHVNPYTGKAWKDDASIATTEYYNELDTLYPFHSGMTQKGRDFGDAAFREWLKNKYKTVDDLNAAWKPAKPFKSFAEVSPFNNKEHRNPVDIPQFVIDKSREMQRFCEKVIREEIGFCAPVHQHNCVIRADVYLLSAEAGSYMANNVYYVHPSAFMSPGSVIGQETSLSMDGAANYWLHAANKRMAGRPYCVTEYQHSHWNPFKHEAGVFFPAYSAFQDFDNLTIHDEAVSSRILPSLSCFEVYNSPVYRANEFISNFLYYRGDVSPSKKRVEIFYDKKFQESSPLMGRGMNHEQAKLAYMTGFSIDFELARKIGELKGIKSRPADWVMPPQGAAVEVWGNSSKPAQEEKKDFDISAAAKILREKSILPPDNVSDPANGIFQTDTGEITLNLKDHSVKVSTPKSEAAALKPETKNASLGRLSAISTSVPASVALLSIDGKDLSESERMVLVYNTDNIATGFEISLSRDRLKSAGKMPFLLRTGILCADLKLPEAGFTEKILGNRKYAVYALKINGGRAEKLDFKTENGVMKICLDTATLKNGPAVFFEIVKE